MLPLQLCIQKKCRIKNSFKNYLMKACIPVMEILPLNVYQDALNKKDTKMIVGVRLGVYCVWKLVWEQYGPRINV